MKNWNWLEEASCVDSDVDFFSEEPEEIQKAKDVCMSCPVRKMCLQSALDNEDRFGVWGGADETQIRRALGVDQYGKPVTRQKQMKCPYCTSKEITTLSSKRTTRHLKCSDCDLTWWSRKPPSLIQVADDEEDEDTD